MDLMGLVDRTLPPEPWAEGDKIPWDDPAFSERMLHQHLSQEHDWASRRQSVIDRHVDWLEQRCLKPGSRILDLGCGPGLYTQCFARRGHHCTGLDIGPSSIAYAREQAAKEGLSIDYQLIDMREATFAPGYDLVMLVFGEFNLFSPADAAAIVGRAYAALEVGGFLVIEGHTYEEVLRQGADPSLWQSAEESLFSARPHLWLEEHFWDNDQEVAVTRYLIVDAATAQVEMHASSMKAYTDDQYKALFREAGFGAVDIYETMDTEAKGFGGRLQVITACKPA